MRKPRHREGKHLFQGDTGWMVEWRFEFPQSPPLTSTRVITSGGWSRCRSFTNCPSLALGCQSSANQCNSIPGHHAVELLRPHSTLRLPAAPRAPPVGPSAARPASPSAEGFPGAGLGHLGPWASVGPLARSQGARELEREK